MMAECVNSTDRFTGYKLSARHLTLHEEDKGDETKESEKPPSRRYISTVPISQDSSHVAHRVCSVFTLDSQITFYATLGVDMVKDAISAPIIKLCYLFKTSDVYFSLFNNKTKDIHSLLRDNITGGPSIIFHRNHEKSQTCIRNNLSKPVQSIEGFDANALYLWALCQNMPTEHPIIRKKDNNFKGEKRDVYGQKCREWLEWLGKRRIRVDGWDSETQTVYQFHGCLFHGHENCSLTRGHVINPFNKKPLVELREKTR
ncbi:hypothetical protein C0Q70_11459 [Pomacea canaliculata]|uniref:DNA-directed DNA polymerase n=1 Tax=Pomacea canaliculata TaxID=400727 RepID=A0A2T7P609_POMCA|nr:hypothetical protein C0Q70_11459 [Pomacea canaliculata]